ncbi:hypothetical protein [Endozoicomonas montiporae]|nr:hypothetical protein [Endozoicomonas montiporae]
MTSGKQGYYFRSIPKAHQHHGFYSGRLHLENRQLHLLDEL